MHNSQTSTSIVPETNRSSIWDVRSGLEVDASIGDGMDNGGTQVDGFNDARYHRSKDHTRLLTTSTTSSLHADFDCNCWIDLTATTSH